MACHQHIYKIHCSVQKLAPFGASGITVTAGIGAWTVGAASATILTTTSDIMLDMIYVSPGNDEYDIEIIDTAGTPNVYATVTAKGIAAMDSMQAIYLGGSSVIPSGTTIQARCQSSIGSNNLTLKIGYKEV